VNEFDEDRVVLLLHLAMYVCREIFGAIKILGVSTFFFVGRQESVRDIFMTVTLTRVTPSTVFLVRCQSASSEYFLAEYYYLYENKRRPSYARHLSPFNLAKWKSKRTTDPAPEASTRAPNNQGWRNLFEGWWSTIPLSETRLW